MQSLENHITIALKISVECKLVYSQFIIAAGIFDMFLNMIWPEFYVFLFYRYYASVQQPPTML